MPSYPQALRFTYKGLKYFDEPEADLFVGREVLTARLAERILALTIADHRTRHVSSPWWAPPGAANSR